MYLYSLSAYGTERLTSWRAVWEATAVTGGWDAAQYCLDCINIVTRDVKLGFFHNRSLIGQNRILIEARMAPGAARRM